MSYALLFYLLEKRTYDSVDSGDVAYVKLLILQIKGLAYILFICFGANGCCDLRRTNLPKRG